MTYSCAYWEHESSDLTGAQFAKCALIAQKLGLRRRMRVLDIGCGWGTFALHAARTYGANIVGVTLSEEQASYAQQRIKEAGVADHVQIRVQDYRDLADPPFDAIASIGMAEHVGERQLPDYAATIARLLTQGGRVVNHAIARPQFRPGPTSEFIDRYNFLTAATPLYITATLAGEDGWRPQIHDRPPWPATHKIGAEELSAYLGPAVAAADR